MEVQILDYKTEHQPAFEQLNRNWIEKYFWLEPIDLKVLQDPEQYILEKGGHILMASVNNKIAGTVALKPAGTHTYEFTKMAVDESIQGMGIGKQLAVAAIAWCKQAGASAIILYSNTTLTPAINLYRKLGFREVTLDGIYKRSDIKMQLDI